MNTKHTSGPWRRHEDFVAHEDEIAIGGGETGECIVAIVWPQGDDKETPVAEQVANANLIIAAPDLLTACKEYISTGQGMYSRYWEMMKAAIAKAEGAK